MTYYVYSTLSTDVKYTEYHPLISGQKIARVKKSVLIEGKANIANKNLITPKGVMTKISDEDFECLKSNSLFKIHEENGYIKWEKKALDVEKVIVEMKPRDVSAPVTPEFYKNIKEQNEDANIAVPENFKKRKKN